MGLLELAGLVVSLAAVFAFVNYRFIGLPTSIGVMLLALGVSMGILVAGRAISQEVAEWAEQLLGRIDFSRTVLEGMLSFLLFAGALFVDLQDLAKRKYVIAGLATLGVLLSTFFVGGLAWWIFDAMGLGVSAVWCLVLGAVLAPTDPIAVLGILRTAGVPKSLETKIVGESLFNDGVAVVVFLILAEIAGGGGDTGAGEIVKLFATEAAGGVLFGLVLGSVAHWMLRSIDHYQVEILVTLAVVLGGYALAGALHVSGPLAMVVAGLLLGNRSRRSAMSETTKRHLDTFWELLDEILNAVLFLLIGMEVLVLSFGTSEMLAGVVMIPVVLIGRLVSVVVPVGLLRPFRDFSKGVVPVLTWGGLRGGISVALALSLPAGEARALFLPVTYMVVLFSLIGQGLTVGRVARRLAAG